MEIIPVSTTVARTYRLTHVGDDDTVRDSARCPITPEEATVRFHNYDGTGLHASYIRIRGRRQRGEKTKGTFSDGGFSVTNGTALPGLRGDAPPAWVQDVVDMAIADADADAV